MKFKNIIKTIFTTYLCILMICLYISSFIGYSKESPSALSTSMINLERPLDTFDYRVLDKNEYTSSDCFDVPFYHYNGYVYYLNCGDVNNIYISWSNGRIKSLMDSLNDNEVVIDDLIENKGLNALKYEE